MVRKTNNLFLLVVLIVSGFSVEAQLNLIQRSLVAFPGQSTAGVWHYVDSLQHEYALVGTQNGISIVDVTNPSAPNFILQVPGVTSNWHEVKTWSHFAYATSEGVDTNGVNDGLQIIELRYLPDSAPVRYWHGDGAISGQLHTAHTLQITNGKVFINGHNIFSLGRGVIIADLADPISPHFMGAETMQYCHDSFVRGDTLWASELTSGFSVYDISHPSNPVMLASQSTPGNFNHNAWLSDNGNVLFTTDEVNHGPVAAFDVSNLNNIEELDEYSVSNIIDSNYNDEVHNVRVINDYLVNACYGSQVTIVDAARPANLIEVGYFPILSSLSWDVDPYLPSGNILATGKQTGLYVLSPTYQRACYLEGLVTDSLTIYPVSGVTVQILATNIKVKTNITGEYKTGCLTAGTYSIQFSKSGYYTKIIPGTLLSNGTLTTLNVQLVQDHSGIEDAGLQGSVMIVPNPFHSFTRLFIDEKLLNQNGSLDFILKDIEGRTAMKINQILSAEVKISANELAAGIYYYELRNHDCTVSKGKLVIE
jgi:choice-of-anchor B domain-containing protein